MADELDFVEDMADAQLVFDQLEAAGLIVRQAPFIIIEKFLRVNPVKSFRHAIGAWKEILAIQDGEAKEALYRELKQQRGSMALTEWRDKDGQPHDVLFEVAKYGERVESLGDEPLMNPSATPDEPLMNPSATPQQPIGKTSGKSKKENYKGEKKTPPDLNQDPAPRPSGESAENRNFADEPRPIKPSAALKRSALAQDAINHGCEKM